MLNPCWLIGAHSVIGHCTLSGQIIHSNKLSKMFLIMINECFSETEFLNKMNNNKKLLLVSSRGSQKDWYLNTVEFSKLGIFIYKQFCWTHIKNNHVNEICVFWFKSKCLCIENEEGCVTKCKVAIISLIVVLLGYLFCFSWIYISLV